MLFSIIVSGAISPPDNVIEVAEVLKGSQAARLGVKAGWVAKSYAEVGEYIHHPPAHAAT